MKPGWVLAFCLAAAAQENLPRSTPKADVGTAVKSPVVDFWDSMSDYFRQSQRAIMLISQKGIPDQEIPAVLYIARHSSASPNQIIEARLAGKPWPEIASENKVKLAGNDFVSEANIAFLSDYHGRRPEEIRAMRTKGASFVDINQEFRRSGGTPKRKTEK